MNEKRRKFVRSKVVQKKNQIEVTEDPVLDERVNKLHSYFISLNEKEKEINQEVSNEVKEATVEPVADDDRTPIRHLMEKPKKKKGKKMPDIPCNSVASAMYKIGTGQPSTSEPVASAIKPFDYQSFDYSKFSSKSKNASSKNFFDPMSKLNENLNKNFSKHNKRKNEKLSMSNKKRKH